MSRRFEIRRALLVGAAITLAACNSDTHIVVPPASSANNGLFSSYVAIGNSITAGMQSGGINDSTQQRSYAFLLAKQMGTSFAYPSLVPPGCPPPISNALTGARLTPPGFPTSTGTTCYLRTTPGAGFPSVLNNVGVPGISSLETTTATGNGTSGALQQLILGGETQVQKAIDAKPTFVTVWIGNNDILNPALSGFPSGLSPSARPGDTPPGPPTTVQAFQANYSKMINQLVAGAQGVKGVLVGVVQVANVPLMFSASVLRNPTVQAAASAAVGKPVTLDPNTCTLGAGDQALIALPALIAIASRPAQLGSAVYCNKIFGGGPNDPGDAGVLDVGEQATVAALINGYNAYIKAKADSIGFGFYDPNPSLLALRQAGAIPAFPNLASTTLTFGQYFSLDGVHPSSAAHILLANGIIGVINAKYGTSLATIPTS